MKARQNWGACLGKRGEGEKQKKEKGKKGEGGVFRGGGGKLQACPHPDRRTEVLLKIVANI